MKTLKVNGDEREMGPGAVEEAVAPKAAPIARAVETSDPNRVWYHGANKVGTEAIEQSGSLGGSRESIFLTPDKGLAATYAQAKGGQVFAVLEKDIPSELLAGYRAGGVEGVR